MHGWYGYIYCLHLQGRISGNSDDPPTRPFLVLVESGQIRFIWSKSKPHRFGMVLLMEEILHHLGWIRSCIWVFVSLELGWFST